MTTHNSLTVHIRADDIHNPAGRAPESPDPHTGGKAGAVRLDRWLADRLDAHPDLPNLSRSRLKSLIQSGHVSVGGVTIDGPSDPVKPGGDYRINIPAPEPASPKAEAIPLHIIFEDEHLILVNKPPGMAVHPAPGSPDGTLVNALLAHCGESLSGIGGVRRPGIVHRLDKNTTGLLVAAKSDESHSGLVHQFAARSVQRSYAALVWGVPNPAAGRIEGPIGRSRRNRKKMAVTAHGGKAAATNYRLERRFGDIASLVECRLESGRTHQIRVHMTHMGHALIGDPLYGGGDRRRGVRAEEESAVQHFGRQALHARSLGFRHPASGETLSFTAPEPPDFMALSEVFSSRENPPE